MTSSKPPLRNVPPPAGAKAASPYARFIPREELSAFSAWKPGALSGEVPPGMDRRRGVTAPEAAAPPMPDTAALVHAARQQGYQDGYRDGLVALEGFKQSFALQTTSQVGALLHAVNEQLDALQQQMAQALAAAATALARQVVRSELSVRPELVAEVATEALDTLLLSARHIVLRVHPDDHALVSAGAADDMAARGARLVADSDISRGGCIVESDLGVIDASIETRWQRAAALLGSEQPFAAAAAMDDTS
jgi:flagellar assembly protein FliH